MLVKTEKEKNVDDLTKFTGKHQIWEHYNFQEYDVHLYNYDLTEKNNNKKQYISEDRCVFKWPHLLILITSCVFPVGK